MSSTPQETNSYRLRLKEVQRRSRDHASAQYPNYALLVKSIVFPIAAISLYRIVVDPNLAFRFGLVVFWTVSFLFSVVTIAKWNRGSLMNNGLLNSLDTIIPAAFGILESLLFLVLDPEFSGRDHWTLWYLVFAFHGALAFGLVWNRIAHTSIRGDYERETRTLAILYIKWLRHDLRGTAAIAIGSGIIFGLTYTTLLGPSSQVLHIIIGLALCVLGSAIIHGAITEYRQILTFRPVRILPV